MYGTFETWLNTSVQLDYDAGTSLSTILDDIKNKMGAFSVTLRGKAASLSVKEAFVFDGLAKDAFKKLENIFADSKLHLFLRNESVCGICYEDNTGYIISHKLEYMSAPPQANAGGEEGSAYTTVTAPWIPQLRPGDRLEIPQRVYMRFFNTVGTGKATQFIQVTTMSIHFGTTGGVNSMTVQGFNVK